MGAVYQAAVLSKAFKVKPFLVRDAAVFPIQVEFSRDTDEEGVKSVKHNKRILFQRMAPYPQRKVITFNRYTDDFTFEVNYGDLSFLTQDDLNMFGSRNLTTVKLSGVGSSFQKHSDAESKGIKAHFNMDESGLLVLDRVESVFETIVEEKEEESTLTKLGNTISTLFGGGSSEPAPNITEPVQDEEEVPPESGKDDKDQESNDGQKDEVDKDKQDQSEKSDSEKGTTEEEGSKTEAKDEKDAAKSESADKEADKKAKPQKKSKISDEIAVELVIHDIVDPTSDEVVASKKKLQDLTDRDLAKQEREKTLNNLEAFIFETQDKMYQDDYQLVVSEEEQEQILAKLKEASEWMDEDGYSATTKELRGKLSGLKSLCKDMFFRVEERRKWPERLASLESMLNTSSFFLKSARLIPEDDQIFTEVELNVLEKVINETTTWKNETVAEQEKRSPKERPVLLSKDIENKLGLLDREVNYLLNKAKFAKPKTKPKVKNGTSSEKSSKANSTAEETVIPPSEENSDKTTESPEEVQPGEAPPTEDNASQTESDDQPQPAEETGRSATPHSDDAGEL
ncbi:hypothetical protein WMY93_016921 [Mugilogobius chulae]|uniref:Hypoxia up-regulated protein 1 n=1 Tax=Mugilogobius chulae TaxID=88201 RepID=A0AAW0NT69_9GOBI